MTAMRRRGHRVRQGWVAAVTLAVVAAALPPGADLVPPAGAASASPVRSVAIGGFPTAVDWSRDGTYLAVGTGDNRVVLVEAATGTARSTATHPDDVESVGFRGDGTQLVAAGYSHALRTWSVPGLSAVRTLPTPPGFGIVFEAAFAPSGPTVAAAVSPHGAEAPRLTLYNADTGAILGELRGASWEGVTGVAWHPGGGFLAVGGARTGDPDEPPFALVVDAGLSVRCDLTPHFTDRDSYVRALAWSPTGDRVAGMSDDNQVNVFRWTGAACQHLLTFRANDARNRALAWHPGGDLLAVGDGTGIAFLDPDDAARKGRVELGVRPRDLAWSPDGAAIASVGDDGMLRILAFTPSQPPSAPTGLAVARGAAAGSLDLAWAAPLDDGGEPVLGYRVYGAPAAGPLALVAEVAGTAHAHVGLGDGATWRYQVAAFSAAGEGARTPEAQGTTNRGPVARLAPTAPAECADGRGTIALDASASSDPEGDALDFAWSAPGATFEPPGAPRTQGSFPLGAHEVAVEVRDGSLRATARAAALVEDTTPPTSRLSKTGLAGDAGWWRSAVTLLLQAADACGPATTWLGLDGAPPAPADRGVVAGDGGHVAAYFAVDASANPEDPNREDIPVDATPPQVAASARGPQGLEGWFRGAVDVALAAGDATSGVHGCSLGLAGAPAVPWFSLTLTADGRHDVAHACRDVAGNWANGSLAVRLDQTPPQTTATAAGTAGLRGWWRSEVTVDLAATDATSGVAATYHAVDGGPWQPGAAALVQGDGRHVVRFYSVDVAGNEEPPGELEVRIDATPPQPGTTDPQRGSLYVGRVHPSGPPGAEVRVPLPFGLLAVVGEKRLAGNATDATSGVHEVAVWLDDAPVARAAAPGEDKQWAWVLGWDAGRAGAGFHRLRVEATDMAGNAAEEAFDLATLPTSLRGALATDCLHLATPDTCAAIPPEARVLPMDPPDLAGSLDAACRPRLHPAACAALRGALGSLLGP